MFWAFVVPGIVIMVVLVPTILVLYDYVEAGFSDKTLWDWMEVLGVPVVVVVIGGLLAMAAQRAGRSAELQRELATDQAREGTLREYLNHMSDLILNHDLSEASEDSPVRAVAHARTHGALRSLNGTRKGILVRFLQESKLISKDEPVVSLTMADLSASDLSGADLRSSEFSRANLRNADFSSANLRGANLYRSVVDEEELAKAHDLVGATMPDGTEMTEDRWNRLKASLI